MLGPLRELPARWREEADLLRRRGAPGPAVALEGAAEDLEEELRRVELEELTLEEAAAEVGVEYDTMQRRVARGEVPNAGEKGRPRVRRRDLYPVLRRGGLIEEMAALRMRGG